MKNKVDLSQTTIAEGVETRTYLVVCIDGESNAGSNQDNPINISLVIDRSGSMRGPKLEFIKQAALDLVRRLGEKDTFSLVAYDDVIEVPIPTSRVTDKGVIRRAINALTARNMTDLGSGWQRGCELVEEGLANGQVTRVLLLSDGLANRGITNHVKLELMAGQKRAHGITTSTMGVGLDFNESLLSRMAAEGGGSFYFIDHPDQAPAFFSEELRDLQRVVGKNLAIQLELGLNVRGIQQITDYPMRESGGRLCYQMGELFAEEERLAVFELSLLAKETGTLSLGNVKVSFDMVGEDGLEEQTSFNDLRIQAVKEGKYKPTLPEPELLKVILIQRSGRARRKAVELADLGNFQQAADLLREMAGEIAQVQFKDKDLSQERDMLLEEANDIEAGRQRFDAYARKVHAHKFSHLHRYERHKEQVKALHMRHLDSRDAYERSGPTPTSIIMGDQEIPLQGDCIRIGSAPDNDIVLDGRLAADYQCQVEREGDKWYVVHIARNAIFRTHFNSGHLHGRCRLSINDVLRFGMVVLHFR